ncbi:unnamed protein product [Somion occarium]|uniref:CAP-Gly domain-containing protein n=1 Tax=Somion occarium TaxID=3059160 RepID=A0ABP1DCW0_9APHY
MESLHSPQVGRRINYAGYLGTIRYVGPVDGTQGVWLGVEWDDAHRGKHDGLKNGKRYFTCLVPNAGSFIRTTAQISYGTSFLTALTEKYIENPRNSSSVEKVILGSSNGAIEVEAVGLDKIRAKLSRLDTLREASLDSRNVATAGSSGDIRRTCPDIRGLDLSKNLLPSWDVVALIATELGHLERLALNQNRMTLPRSAAIIADAFRQLRELQLNDTMTTWYELRVVIRYMPELQHVEVGYNRLRALEIPNQLSKDLFEHPNIRSINFDSNELHCWAEICEALRPITALDRLLLSSNQVGRIEPIADATKSPVRNLNHLALSFNALAEWTDIDHLVHWCPHLESLKLTGNPLMEGTQPGKNTRQLTIARIATLQTLDAAGISSRERTDSELYYLSYITKHGPSDESARCLEHPRWKELCEKYGKPDEQASSSKNKRDTLGNRLLRINIFRCSRSTSIHSSTNAKTGPNSDLNLSEPTALRVLPSMSMRAFHLKVAKSFKLPKGTQALKVWLKMPDDALIELPSEDDTHDLSWWGIEDGSGVILKEIHD